MAQAAPKPPAAPAAAPKGEEVENGERPVSLVVWSVGEPKVSRSSSSSFMLLTFLLDEPKGLLSPKGFDMLSLTLPFDL